MAPDGLSFTEAVTFAGMASYCCSGDPFGRSRTGIDYGSLRPTDLCWKAFMYHCCSLYLLKPDSNVRKGRETPYQKYIRYLVLHRTRKIHWDMSLTLPPNFTEGQKVRGCAPIFCASCLWRVLVSNLKYQPVDHFYSEISPTVCKFYRKWKIAKFGLRDALVPKRSNVSDI